MTSKEVFLEKKWKTFGNVSEKRKKKLFALYQKIIEIIFPSFFTNGRDETIFGLLFHKS